MARAALALLLAACGSSAPPPVAIEAFPAAAQDALCAFSVRCRHVPDDATCRRLIDPRDYDLRRTLDAMAAGRLRWDAAAAGRCVAALEDAVCAATPFGDLACGEMIVGLVEPGAPCTSPYECAGGAPCEDAVCDAQCCLGTCGAPVSTVPPVLGAAGDPCATHTDCEPGTYCELDRHCAPLPDQAGDHCLFGCAWGDLYCDIATETCLRFAALDETCAPTGLAPPCDPTYAFCDPATATCRPRPGPGDPCDLSERRCIASTWCDSGRCAPPSSPATPCTDDTHCTVACDGTCVEYAPCPAGTGSPP